MAKPIFGQLEEFDPNQEAFSTYEERVRLFLLANDVEDEKKVPIFLSIVGAKNFALLRDLFVPEKPAEKTLDELLAKMMKHFEPDPSVLAERYAFHCRSQGSSESIADYVAELKRLSTHCAFGAYLDEALRDRFVFGIRKTAIRKRLLSEKTLTFSTAVELAQSMELVEQQARLMNDRQEVEIDKIRVEKTSGSGKCHRCGRGGHDAKNCRFKNAVCHLCKKRGHIQAACHTRSVVKRNGSGRGLANAKETRWIELKEVNEERLRVYQLENQASSAYRTEVLVNSKKITFEIDTGAAVSLMSKRQFRQIFPNEQLKESSLILWTYSAERLTVAGELDVDVEYQIQKRRLRLVVVNENGPALIGRNWLGFIKLSIGIVSEQSNSLSHLEKLFSLYSDVFKEEPGRMTQHVAKLQLKASPKPKFWRPRPVPFAFKDGVEMELERLTSLGIIKPVNYSEWAAPIVIVPNRNGKMRLCGDFKVTINSMIDVDQYPLPRPNDLFTALAGGQKFTKLDLSQAYQQLPLDEESQKLVTINTQRGLFQFTRLPFGIASAPALFQRVMDIILQGIPHTICYIDDIAITGSSDEEHFKNVEEVLRRLKFHGINVNKEKCKFLCDRIEYLGHVITAEGVHTEREKVKAIVEAPNPKNLQELRSLLGLINYYGKFIHNLSTIWHPLNHLLRDSVEWNLSKECEEALKLTKQALSSSEVLIHYNPALPLRLATDASQQGVGAVLSHVDEQGNERPIAYASRTLTKAECKYAQIEREALAIIYGVKKFHQYVCGRKFSLITDHKPLTVIFHQSKGISAHSAARLQRWALLLSGYSYEIEYKSSKENSNADAFSRLPLENDSHMEDIDTISLFQLSHIQHLPVDSTQIKVETEKDKVLSVVLRYTKEGWPTTITSELKPYYNRRNEIVCENNVLLWGIRVIIPESIQNKVLQVLHEGHPGINRMKALARCNCWWPGIDSMIEKACKACLPCRESAPMPVSVPLHPWIWPAKPWQRLHADFAGPIEGRMYLLLIDAHSKWPEIFELTSTTAEKTVETFCSVFARYGLPELVVTDNGPQFVAEGFQKFLRENGVKHIRSPPYNPSSNGQVERLVQTFKKALVKGRKDGMSSQHALANFLLKYRTTPHSVTGVAPCELMFKRPLRTVLDLMRPNVNKEVVKKQVKQKQNYDRSSRFKVIELGQSVMVRDYRDRKRKWVQGVVKRKLGNVTCLVEVNGQLCKRHLNQLYKVVEDSDYDHPALTEEQEELQPTDESQVMDSVVETAPADNVVDSRRYPQRSRHPPLRFSEEQLFM